MMTPETIIAEPVEEIREIPGEGEMESPAAVMEETPNELKDKGSDFVQFLLVSSINQCLSCGVLSFCPQSMCARNFYKFKLIALAMAFCINILLLFFKVLGDSL